MFNLTPSKLMIFLTLIEFVCSIFHAYDHNIPWLIASIIITLLGGFMSIWFVKDDM